MMNERHQGRCEHNRNNLRVPKTVDDELKEQCLVARRPLYKFTYFSVLKRRRKKKVEEKVRKKASSVEFFFPFFLVTDFITCELKKTYWIKNKIAEINLVCKKCYKFL